jgi:hypothetical protein
MPQKLGFVVRCPTVPIRAPASRAHIDLVSGYVFPVVNVWPKLKAPSTHEARIHGLYIAAHWSILPSRAAIVARPRWPDSENWLSSHMSKLNPRNYQARLAFDEPDLRTTEHDQMMHWLAAWVRHESNIRPLIGAGFRERQRIVRHVPEADTWKEMQTLPESIRRAVSGHLTMGHRETYHEVTEPWPQEPVPMLEYRSSQWELPLMTGRGPPVAYCDLYCEWNVGYYLNRVTQHIYKLDSLDPPKTPYGIQTWSFTKTGETEEWSQSTAILRLFFGVKSAIPSVGERNCSPRAAALAVGV